MQEPLTSYSSISLLPEADLLSLTGLALCFPPLAHDHGHSTCFLLHLLSFRRLPCELAQMSRYYFGDVTCHVLPYTTWQPVASGSTAPKQDFLGPPHGPGLLHQPGSDEGICAWGEHWQLAERISIQRQSSQATATPLSVTESETPPLQLLARGPTRQGCRTKSRTLKKGGSGESKRREAHFFVSSALVSLSLSVTRRGDEKTKRGRRCCTAKLTQGET